MSNQEKEQKKKKKVRIKTKEFLKPYPRLEYISIRKLYLMLEDKFKEKEYKEIKSSLKKHGYAPEKEEFDYIKIKAYFDMGYKIVDGRKRIAVLGKNNLQRGIALGQAVKVSDSVAKDIAPFKKVLDAVHKGQNIHTGELKSAKLKLCDEVENFGNFIANSTVGETDENVRQVIDEGKYSAKEDLDEPF